MRNKNESRVALDRRMSQNTRRKLSNERLTCLQRCHPKHRQTEQLERSWLARPGPRVSRPPGKRQRPRLAADQVEVQSSHVGMAVNADVFRAVATALAGNRPGAAVDQPVEAAA